MKYLIIVLTALCLSNTGFAKVTYDEILSNSISEPELFIAQPFDVKKYNVFLDLSKYPTTEMTGICNIELEWLESPAENTFFFHLRDLVVDSVLYNTLPVDAFEVGEPEDATYHWEITPPEQLSTTTATITIHYHGTMTTELNTRNMKWGGVQYRDSILFAMGVGFYNNYVSTTQHWMPCFDLPSDKAKFEASFLIPENLMVASNGLGKEIILNDDNTELHIWEHNFDCATYNYTFALGPYKELKLQEEGLPISIYSKSEDYEKCKNNFKLVGQMVDVFENRFGTYPFESVGYVLTPIGSMEHETMISFAYKLVRFSNDTINETAAHELAHMWFGDCVTPYDFRDAWLNESFATFCEAIWAEELFDYNAYLKNLDNNRAYYISNPNGSRSEGIFPLYDFPRTAPSSNYPLTIYFKGAVVVGMLRYELGDSLFFEALQKYVEQQKYSNANTDTLKSILEATSGTDLTEFFEQWIYRKGWPEINTNFYTYDIENNLYSLSFQQIQNESWEVFKNVPIEVGFEDEEGSVEYRIFTINNEFEKFEVDLDFICSKITINKGPTIRPLVNVKYITYTDVEESFNQKVKVYPNPSDSQVVFSFPAGNGIANIRVFDSYGNLVLNKDVKVRKGNNQYIFRTDELSSGTYYINIDSGIGTITEKFNIIR